MDNVAEHETGLNVRLSAEDLTDAAIVAGALGLSGSQYGLEVVGTAGAQEITIVAEDFPKAS